MFDVGETAVRILVIELQPTRSLQYRALRYVKLLVFHSIRHPYDDQLLVIGCWDLERRGNSFEKPGNTDVSLPAGFVEFPGDRHELRVKNSRDDRGEHLEPRISALTAEDGQNGVALFFSGFCIDERLHRPIPFVQGSGPGICDDPGKAIQLHVAETSFGDVHSRHALTTLLGIWEAGRIAGT